MVCGSISIARHVGGIEMLKPSEARVTVDQPAGKGLFVGDGDGVGVGVGVGDGDADAVGDEQPAARSKARIRIGRRNIGGC
jgi:hypothetical protein